MLSFECLELDIVDYDECFFLTRPLIGLRKVGQKLPIHVIIFLSISTVAVYDVKSVKGGMLT